MISRVRGVLESLAENRVELRSGSLAFELFVPSYLERELVGKRGEEIELFTLYYLEGGAGHSNMFPRLVGFGSPGEKEFYLHLIRVPGMGARSVLKSMTVPPSEMAAMIERGDKAGLARLPGLGKRSADKVVAALKGKVSGFAFGPEAAAGPALRGEAEEEAAAVLVQLGYRRPEAEELLAEVRKKHPGLEETEALVQAALKEAGRRAVR